jgi:hypothetical protein
LRGRQILGVKIFPRIGDERRITWMIDRFHAGNRLHPLGIVLVNMLDQFDFRIGRPGDKNSPGVRHRFHDGVKVVLILGGVSAADGIGLVMDV